MFEKGYAVPELLTPALPPRPQLVSATNRLADSARDCRRPAALFLLIRYARWRRNRWRREALLALNHPHTVDSWMQLIKRVQLVHQPRQMVSQTLAPEAVLASLTLDADLRDLLIARYCRADNAPERPADGAASRSVGAVAKGASTCLNGSPTLISPAPGRATAGAAAAATRFLPLPAKKPPTSACGYRFYPRSLTRYSSIPGQKRGSGASAVLFWLIWSLLVLRAGAAGIPDAAAVRQQADARYRADPRCLRVNGEKNDVRGGNTRLQAVQQSVRKFVAARQSDRIGMVIFASKAPALRPDKRR